jgi:hypothetical protein
MYVCIYVHICWLSHNKNSISLYIHMHDNIYACMIYIHLCVHTYTLTHTHTCVFVCSVCMHVCTEVCVYVCMRASVCVAPCMHRATRIHTRPPPHSHCLRRVRTNHTCTCAHTHTIVYATSRYNDCAPRIAHDSGVTRKEATGEVNVPGHVERMPG